MCHVPCKDDRHGTCVSYLKYVQYFNLVISFAFSLCLCVCACPTTVLLPNPVHTLYYACVFCVH